MVTNRYMSRISVRNVYRFDSLKYTLYVSLGNFVIHPQRRLERRQSPGKLSSGMFCSFTSIVHDNSLIKWHTQNGTTESAMSRAVRETCLKKKHFVRIEALFVVVVLSGYLPWVMWNVVEVFATVWQLKCIKIFSKVLSQSCLILLSRYS